VLLAEGHQVVGVDNLCTGSLDNLAHLKREPRFFFEQRDITTPFDPGEVSYVFNMASPASPVDYMRLGIETLLVGSAGTLNTLEIAKKYGAGYLHASTSECYGDPMVHPQVETYWGNVNPIGPRSVYDEAKRFSEAAVTAYNRYHGVSTHLVRIFNTYGPRLQPNDGRLISNLVMQALRGESLTIYGDGSQTRSFCYVSDLIEGIVKLSRSDEHDPVNIGNPSEWTILECAKEVQALVGSHCEIVFKPLPQDDPMRRRPDITKAKSLLGWEPKVALREGLTKSLEYFKQCVAAEAVRA
jgi:dTDP-glucose 4,6-dehydratase